MLIKLNKDEKTLWSLTIINDCKKLPLCLVKTVAFAAYIYGTQASLKYCSIRYNFTDSLGDSHWFLVFLGWNSFKM